MPFAHTRCPVRRFALRTALPVVFLSLSAAAAPPATTRLAPIGAGYSEATLRQFAATAARRDTSGLIDIVVLPIAFSPDAITISDKDRRDNLALAERRRGEVEAACIAVRRPAQTCNVRLAPILVRSDAQSPGDFFAVPGEGVDGVFILGGDQAIAMQVVANTPTEERMAAAYVAGAAVGGTSAGAAAESVNMVAGYIGDSGPDEGLRDGSVDLWEFEGKQDLTRGLIFGLPNAIIDQHVYARGRIGRMLNFVGQTLLPGIGLEEFTGATIENETRLIDVIGDASAIIIDPKAYAASASFVGPTKSLSIRRVATHLVPPGGFGYDLAGMRPLVNGRPLPAPVISGRTFDGLRTGAAGALLVGGDISGDKTGIAARHFVGKAGGKIVVIAAGYAKSADAQAEAKAFASAFQSLGAPTVQWFVLDAKSNVQAIRDAIIKDARGVFLTARDQSLVMRDLSPVTGELSAAWRKGTVLMADNAAAAALGGFLSIDAPPTASSLEADATGDFLSAQAANVSAGFGFAPLLAIEPRLLPDRRWGRLYNLLSVHPATLAIGVDIGTAVEITQAGAKVLGSSAAVVLDGRYASFGVGNNGALSARYVVLDSFVDNEEIAP